MALIRLAEDEPDQAFAQGSQALTIQVETGHPVGQAEAHLVLSQCDPDPQNAAEHLAAARRIYAETGAVPVPGLPL